MRRGLLPPSGNLSISRRGRRLNAPRRATSHPAGRLAGGAAHAGVAGAVSREALRPLAGRRRDAEADAWPATFVARRTGEETRAAAGAGAAQVIRSEERGRLDLRQPLIHGARRWGWTEGHRGEGLRRLAGDRDGEEENRDSQNPGSAHRLSPFSTLLNRRSARSSSEGDAPELVEVVVPERVALLQPLVVESEALDDVLTQTFRRPAAEPHSAAGAHSVADGENHLQIVVVNQAANLPPALGLNRQAPPDSCRGIELALLEDVPDV
jgi:hypothetical protein